MVGGDAPDPREVAHPGVGEDEPRAGERARQLHRVDAERGDPAAGVDEDRQLALVGEGGELPDGGMVEGELLGAGVQLDALRAGLERPLGLRAGTAVVGVDPAEGREQAVGPRRGVDDHVVGRGVAVGLVHGEDESASRLGCAERVQQFGRGLLHPIGIVLAEVRVGVEELDAGDLLEHQLGPRADDRSDVHIPHSYHDLLVTPLLDSPSRPTQAALTDHWTLGGIPIANRVVLAPLAGIGNWFVRLQAKRHGAGLVVSEMVSSHAVHYRNERTCTELLRIHPDEHPVSVQLFGSDPDVMESAAERVAAAGADLIDLNMGCPVPKVCKTGAGAALLQDPARAVAVARAAGRGSGLPVTVKLRSGARPGDLSGIEVARRLAEEGVVAGLCIHPRHASQRHSGKPDYELARRLVEELPVPVVISGGLRTPELAREAFERTGAAAVALARGSLGNPWLFAQLLGERESEPTRAEILDELEWVIQRAIEHLGTERATRYLRKFYPWYVERLGGDKALQDALQRADSIDAARELLVLA